jgi:hypothetical protein
MLSKAEGDHPMPTLTSRLAPLRTLALVALALTTLNSCGAPDLDQASRLRDRPVSTDAGTLALQDEGDSSIVLVHLPSDRDNVALCAGTSSACLDPNTQLIALTKTSPSYWKSASPIRLQDNLVLHVVGIDSGARSILLSAKLSSNTAGDSQEQPTSELSPPANLPKMRPIPRVQVAFDYQGTLSRASANASVIRMVIQNGPLATAKRVKVKSTLVNLRNSSVKIPLAQEVDVLENGVIDFYVEGLSPETVYRLEGTSVFEVKDGVVSTTVGGPVKHQFHIATTSDTNLSKAKRRAMLRAVAESYDWEYGNYQSSKGYYNGSWCDRFYTWVVAKDFKVSNAYSASSFFRQHRAIQNASKIPALAPNKSMMADMIRYEGTSQGTHTLMIIAYDVATKSIWTVEGNYNNRVMRLKRGVSSSWNHGFLVESQVK